jgi:hypothetical protein
VYVYVYVCMYVYKYIYIYIYTYIYHILFLMRVHERGCRRRETQTPKNPNQIELLLISQDSVFF